MRRSTYALFSLLLFPAAAHADTVATFNISVTADGTTGTGTLTGTSNGDGSYLVRSISATSLLGSATPVVLLAPNDPDFSSDNLFFPSNSRLFDVFGITFTGSFGIANLFSTTSGFEVQGYDAGGTYFDVPATVSLLPSSATPEPSSIVLSFTGMIGAAAAALRRRRSIAIAAR